MSGVCLCKIHHNNPKMQNVVLEHFYNFLGVIYTSSQKSLIIIHISIPKCEKQVVSKQIQMLELSNLHCIFLVSRQEYAQKMFYCFKGTITLSSTHLLINPVIHLFIVLK